MSLLATFKIIILNKGITMTQAIISNDYEVETFESIERIDFATVQFKKLIKELSVYQATELEPLMQQMLTIEDANSNLRTIIKQTQSNTPT